MDYVLGALAIVGDYSDVNKLAFFNPLLIFGVAIFDTIYVMILRLLKGRSPFLGSKDHFAIRLKFAGWPITRIVIGSYVAACRFKHPCFIKYVSSIHLFVGPVHVRCTLFLWGLV